MSTVPPEPAPTPAQSRYGEAVAKAEREFAQALAQADADYTRAQQYAGLLRQELIEQATAKLQRDRHAAQTQYDQEVSQ